MNKIFSLLIVTSHLVTVYCQNTVGTIYNSPGVSSGYTLLVPVNSEQTFLIDNCGREVNRWNSSYQMGMTAYLTDDGSLYRAGRIINTDMSMGGIGGIIEKFDWNGNLTWQFIVSGTDSVAHHDFCVLPNGHILLLIAYKNPISEAFNLGKDTIYTSDSTLYNEAIVEIEPIGFNQANVVWRWHVWDHLIQDRDANKPNFGVVADHPHKMNINYLGYGVDNGRDWMHANSIDYHPQFNQVVISFRNTNEFWIIDHSTTTQEAANSIGGIYGKGGDILYRWGNPAAYDRGNQSNRQLIGQHKVMWIPEGLPGEGNILLFNNGENISYSSIFEISTPVNSSGFYQTPSQQAFDPPLPLWIYNDSLNTLFNSGRLSSAQRLPNGNTLICSGQNGYLTELDSLNNITWSYRNPVTNTGIVSQGNTVPNGINSLFNATKYSPEHPAFIGKTLVVSDPIELNFNLSYCEIANVGKETMEKNDWVTLFPNPTSEEIKLDALIPIKSVYLMDSQGKELLLKESNSSPMKINIENVAPGCYTIVVINEFGDLKRLKFNKF